MRCYNAAIAFLNVAVAFVEEIAWIVAG